MKLLLAILKISNNRFDRYMDWTIIFWGKQSVFYVFFFIDIRILEPNQLFLNPKSQRLRRIVNYKFKTERKISGEGCLCLYLFTTRKCNFQILVFLRYNLYTIIYFDIFVPVITFYKKNKYFKLIKYIIKKQDDFIIIFK